MGSWRRIYRSLTDVGCPIYNGNPKLKKTIPEIAEALPPGGILNVAFDEAIMGHGFTENLIEGLPEAEQKAGSLLVFRGGNEYGGDYPITNVFFIPEGGGLYQKTFGTDITDPKWFSWNKVALTI